MITLIEEPHCWSPRQREAEWTIARRDGIMRVQTEAWEHIEFRRERERDGHSLAERSRLQVAASIRRGHAHHTGDEAEVRWLRHYHYVAAQYGPGSRASLAKQFGVSAETLKQHWQRHERAIRSWHYRLTLKQEVVRGGILPKAVRKVYARTAT